jgi:hypothetical protein
MGRRQQRQYEKEVASVIRKAKKDMESWIMAIGEQPSQLEVIAWQAGYIAGINRATSNLDKLKQQNDASAS